MAIDPSLAVRRTLHFEDPFWDSPARGGGAPESDSGGVARFGLNSLYNPTLPAAFFSGEMPYADALALAIKTYLADYWLPAFLEAGDQGVANVLFDLQVNPGSGAGTRIVQQAANSLGCALTVDGGFGALTLAAINTLDRDQLLVAIQKERWAHYEECEQFGDAEVRAAWRERTFAPPDSPPAAASASASASATQAG